MSNKENKTAWEKLKGHQWLKAAFWPVVICLLTLVIVVACDLRDTKIMSNAAQMTVENVCLKGEMKADGSLKSKAYITTDQGMFSVQVDKYQSLLLLEPQDKVTIGYLEKAVSGPTEISYIHIDYSSSPDIVIEEAKPSQASAALNWGTYAALVVSVIAIIVITKPKERA